MKRPSVWMFSGQGAQYYQMGAPLFREEKVFRETVEYCSERLEPSLGLSLSECIYQSRSDRFSPFLPTLHTHPALFVVQYALARLLKSKGLGPDYLLGYSLGEFVAYAVAECVDLDHALSIVVEHAALLGQAAPKGDMLAIVASPDLRALLPEAFAGLETAADNHAEHFVVAGKGEQIAALQRILRTREIDSFVLPVEYAFHSATIDPAALPFMKSTERLTLASPTVPIISCARVGAVMIPRGADFWMVARDKIRFRETIQWMERRGSYRYIDLGPAGTLASFAKRNLRPQSESTAETIMTPFGRDASALAKVLLES